MDSRTGEIKLLTEQEAIMAEKEWEAWKAGLLKTKPRYVPIVKDYIGRPKPKRKGERSYREFCR
jgi:hypothetical protein